MKKTRQLLLSLTLSLAFLLFSTPAGGIATYAASCNWHIVSSPNPSTQTINDLNAVTAVSASDIWAVGTAYLHGSYNQAIIEHWNGTAWKLVANPPNTFALNGIAAISANDIWAVGGAGSTVTEHWNGSTWTLVPGPNPSDVSILSGVSAVATNNVWAVGHYFDNSNNKRTLVEHWDGKSWSIVASPNVGSNFNALSGVKAITANNVWAVGDVYDFHTNVDQTLIEHWDGSVWKVVSTPSIPSAGFSAITAVTASDMWAVGLILINGGTNTQPLTEHWNGSKWSIVTGPTPYSSFLSGVSALSTNNVWAAGTFNSSSGAASTLVEHWDGTQWTTVSSPSPAEFNYLNGIVAISSTRIWAVGDFQGGMANNIGFTLSETYC
ncbi:MAG TPA: hypothetical protein VKU38_18670 [Ktedonobacteraceae bacterium]|nr:hypothetical protein [Ktedonobacteraceae bacterium]